MNRFSNCKSSGLIGLLALSAGLLTPASEASAQNQMYVGYVNPQETVYPYTGFNNASEEGGTLYFVVRMEASKFANYGGASLTGVCVGWSMGEEEKTPEMEVFVREELDGENLASGSAQVGFGWNDIDFDTPYSITAGNDLYIGGKVEWEPGSWLGTGTWGYTLPESSQFMGNTADTDPDGNINWIDVTDNSMVLMVLGIVEASGSGYNDKAALSDLRTNVIQPMEYPGDAWLVVRNDGFNELQSIELTSSMGEELWSQTIDFSSPIAAGETRDVSGGVQALGTGTHRIWVSKVNGKDVENPVALERDLIGVPAEVAARYTRRPLVERWVSESDYRSPVYTDDIFLPGIESLRESMSVIAHHCSDQFMIYHEFDADVDNEDIRFLVDFADGDKSRVSIPAFSVDRSYLPRNPLSRSNTYSVAYNFIYPDYVEPFYTAALDVPTFATIEAKADVEGDICGIEVTGYVEPGIMPEDEPLRLTVYLVEDGIESTSQEFPDDPEVTDRYKGVYTHDDVIRLSLTEMYGDMLDGDGAYTKKFTCELEPEWKRDDMRVLAFLNRSGERYGHMQVINSCETPVTGSGIGGIRQSVATFTVNGHDIEAAPGHSIEVYTLAGTRVSGRGLDSGIYLVRISGADGVGSCKVAIR